MDVLHCFVAGCSRTLESLWVRMERSSLETRALGETHGTANHAARWDPEATETTTEDFARLAEADRSLATRFPRCPKLTNVNFTTEFAGGPS